VPEKRSATNYGRTVEEINANNSTENIKDTQNDRAVVLNFFWHTDLGN
jgi:hypothetical protein